MTATVLTPRPPLVEVLASRAGIALLRWSRRRSAETRLTHERMMRIRENEQAIARTTYVLRVLP